MAERILPANALDTRLADITARHSQPMVDLFRSVTRGKVSSFKDIAEMCIIGDGLRIQPTIWLQGSLAEQGLGVSIDLIQEGPAKNSRAFLRFIDGGTLAFIHAWGLPPYSSESFDKRYGWLDEEITRQHFVIRRHNNNYHELEAWVNNSLVPLR